jgi:dihydroorotase
MITRRQFVSAAAASAAVLSHATNAPAATYDLIVKGGRVIDPSLRLDGIRDIAISNGRIVAVEPEIPSFGAIEMLDARGKIVVPGLIDIHTHASRTKEGPGLCMADGVTGYVDAGSYGGDGIDEGVANVKAGPNRGRLLVNIARTGVTAGGELLDLRRADIGVARDAIARNRDAIVGVKARLSYNVAGNNDVEGLKRAQEVAAPLNLPVMIHMGQTVSPLPKILEVLKRGDVVTHMYAPPPNSIVDENGRMLPEVLAARRRGVWFDLGNGQAGHLRWDIVERVFQQGFMPDTFSTDWNTNAHSTGVIDLPNVMSKFLLLGMPLDQVVACATVNAARVFEAFNDRGTLNVGAPADIAVLELRDGTFEFLDNYNNTRTGTRRLFPVASVMGGKRAPQRA